MENIHSCLIQPQQQHHQHQQQQQQQQQQAQQQVESVKKSGDNCSLSLPAGLTFKQNCLLHPNEQFSMIVHIIVDQNQLLFKSSFVDFTT